MAEFLNQKTEPEMSFFNAIGQPIPPAAKEKGYEECKAMGLTNKARAIECVSAVAEQLQRDKMYEAQAAGMKFLDFTGTIRLIATLLAHTSQSQPQQVTK